MNNRKRTLITIVCSILLIMPSFLGVPLADGNLVVISTPDSGQVNDEISTNTDLKDYNITTTVTRELLLRTDSYETALSDSGKIQKHIVTMENGNDDNSNTSIFPEHLGIAESHQFSESYVVTEPTLITQAQAPAENIKSSSFWPLIPSYGGVGNATDNVGLLAGPETLPRNEVNSTIVNDAPIPHDTTLTTADDIILNATVLVEDIHSIVEQPVTPNGTLGVITINETTFTPTPDLGVINASQPIFDTLATDQNYMIIYGADLTFNTSDSSQHSILAGDGETNTEQVVSSADTLSEPPITTDYIGSAIAENSPIHIDVLANIPDTNNSSLVVSSTIQGVHETITYNHDENTAFSSENTNSGSSGDGNNRSSHASSDESDDNCGNCLSNPVSHDGQDKHGDDVEGIGGVHDGHHADSESTHYSDTGVSHKDSEHENREGSDDDRDHNDHEDGGQNNHENSDHDDNGQHGDQNDE